MAIQYYMRGFYATGSVYVDWVVNDTPDSTGAFAPVSPLSNIVINKIVTSKVDNFLNPAAEPSFIAPNYPNPLDGYYLHVNSFDWLNPEPPTAGIPLEPTGLAIVRGYSGSDLNPYSTLTWIESDGYWSFNELLSDGTLGPVQSVNMGALGTDGGLTVIDGYIGVSESTYAGDPWASSGIIRIPNSQFIKANNAAHNADITLIGLDTASRVVIGAGAEVYMSGSLRVDGSIASNNDQTSNVVAQSGFIRMPNATTAVAFRNLAQSADLAGISSTSGNLITLGDGNNSGMQIRVGVSAIPLTVPVSVNYFANGVDLLDFNFNTNTQATSISFARAATSPTITQVPQIAAAGQSMFVTAQAGGGIGNLGGPLVLQSGAGDLTASNTGNARLDIGTSGQTLPMFRAYPRSSEDLTHATADYRPYGTSFTQNSGSSVSFNALIRFPDYNNSAFSGFTFPTSNLFGNSGNTGVALTGPTIGQDDATTASGVPMTVSAQWTAFATGTGGSFTARAGSAYGSTGIGGGALFRAGSANTGTTSLGGNVTLMGGNATAGTTTNTGAGSSRAGGNITLMPGTGSGAIGSQTHGEIDWQNAGTTVGRFYADSFVPYAEIGSTSIANPSWHPASVGFIRLAHLPTDGYTAVGYTALAMRNIANNGDILLVGSDVNNNVVIGDGFHNVIIGGNYLNNDVAPSGTNTYIAGNLIVLGTTTTVDSTVVDIVGRLIHANWPENPGSAPPALAPPTLITGFDVNRGYSSSNVMNDGAAMIWTEGVQTVSGSDGYWRFATVSQDGYNTSPRDNYTIASSPNALSVMASSFAAVSNSTMNMTGSQLITSGVLPGVGALRVQNSTTAVAARNASNNADLLLLGTDSSNHILHGGTANPTNSGHVFSTTTGSIFDFWVNGFSQVSIGANEINFTNTDGYSTIQQSPSFANNASGATFTVAAQSVLGTLGIGGNLNLTSGFGSLVDGYLNLQVAGANVVGVEPADTLGHSKFVFFQGRRRNIRSIITNYLVVPSDDYLAVGVLTSAITITLPVFPIIGDAYEIKDTSASAGAFNITVSGNGSNIDGSPTFVVSTNYSSLVITYTGTQWSIS